MNSELEGRDVVEVLTAQRNAAMDEIVRQGAIILKQQREMEILRIAANRLTELDRSTGLEADSSVDRAGS